jgi:phage terminase small subunit
LNKAKLTEALNAREQKFVVQYLVAPTGTQAALVAGYTSNPSSQASRILRRGRIRNAIERARMNLAERNGIDQDKIVEMLYQSYVAAKYKGNAMNMLKAAREIGLLCGLYPQPEK